MPRSRTESEGAYVEMPAAPQEASRGESLYHKSFFEAVPELESLADTRSCLAKVFFCCSPVPFKQVLDQVQNQGRGITKDIDAMNLKELMRVYKAAQDDSRLNETIADKVCTVIVKEAMNCFEVKDIEAELYQGLKDEDKQAALNTWLYYIPEQRHWTKSRQMLNRLTSPAPA